MKNSTHIEDLYKAFAMLKDNKEIERFMIDLCTPNEIQAFAERWAIAQMLEKGELSYREISEATGASTTTVARVARFLNQEHYQGYKMVLERIKKKKH